MSVASPIPLPYTVFQVRVAATVSLDDVKEYLGLVDPLQAGWEDVLTDLLDEALEAGDEYTINPFLDEDDAEKAIPLKARFGVLAYIAAEWPVRIPGTGRLGLQGFSAQGPLQSEKVGDLSKTYGAATSGKPTGIDTTADGESLGMVAAKPHWRRLRLQPGQVRRRAARATS